MVSHLCPGLGKVSGMWMRVCRRAGVVLSKKYGMHMGHLCPWAPVCCHLLSAPSMLSLLSSLSCSLQPRSPQQVPLSASRTRHLRTAALRPSTCSLSPIAQEETRPPHHPPLLHSGMKEQRKAQHHLSVLLGTPHLSPRASRPPWPPCRKILVAGPGHTCSTRMSCWGSALACCRLSADRTNTWCPCPVGCTPWPAPSVPSPPLWGQCCNQGLRTPDLCPPHRSPPTCWICSAPAPRSRMKRIGVLQHLPLLPSPPPGTHHPRPPAQCWRRSIPAGASETGSTLLAPGRGGRSEGKRCAMILQESSEDWAPSANQDA